MKKVFRNMRYFIPLLLKLSPWTIVLMICIAIFSALNNFAWIIFPKMIIEECIVAGEKDIKKIAIIIILFVTVRFLFSTLISIFEKINSYFADIADLKIGEMFNQKITSIDYFHIEDPEFADILDRARKGLNQYSNGIYSVIYTLEYIITGIITISGVIGIVLFSGEYWMMLVTVIGLLANTVIYSKIQKIDKDFNDSIVRHNRRQWYYNNTIMSFRTQKDLRLYNAREMIEDVCKKENDETFSEYEKHATKLKKLNFLDNTITYFLTRSLTIILLIYSVYYHNSTIPIFTMLYSAIQTLDNSLASLVYNVKKYIQDCTYQDVFIDLMGIKSVFKDGVRKIDHIETIEFKNVSFKYPRTNTYVLKDLNFKITNKEKVSLVGLNGSGKTTMIKLLCRFFEVKEGEILVNGVNINLYNYEDYMKQIAIVFQDFKIISFTVQSNVAILDKNQEKLYDCLKRAQVLDKILSLPKKEYTYVNKWFDKTGVEFSGGEMQKFAIARCLYKNSDLVILDEPTSALDPMAEAEIYYHFNEIIGHKLTFFISHRLSSCIFSDRILVLDGARIVEEGTHKELMRSKDGLYHQMFLAQAEYYKS